MRRSFPLVAILLASCGPTQNRSSLPAQVDMEPMTYHDVADAPTLALEVPRAAPQPPNVSPTSAPGVAFNYRYAFRLPVARIAAVQEQHAQACERLGVARCRITGMLYRLVDDRNIEASLQLKLDPRLARQFGRASVDAVTRSDGRLTESEISGVDAVGSIRSAGRGIADLTGDLERVDARLARSGLPAGERTRLEQEASQLRQQIRGLRDSRDEQQDSLATTPMIFRYAAADTPPPAPAGPTFAGTFARAVDNFSVIALVLLTVLLTLLPWALVAGAIWWLIRRYWPRTPALDEPTA
jgi:hypothetical protein